jgi:hypothetical protein
MTSKFVANLNRKYGKTNSLKTLFLESYVTDQKILEENARSVKISSPDVSVWPNFYEFGLFGLIL